jgi:hypothetical protein
LKPLHTSHNFFNSRNDESHRISKKYDFNKRKNGTIDEFDDMNTSKSSNFKAKGF